MRLSSKLRVLQGLNSTKVLQKAQKRRIRLLGKGAFLSADQCFFAVVDDERTLDLQASSVEEATRWVCGLRRLIEGLPQD
ncbi:MAG: hypothetical protein MHM6MM_008930 [Cercozoa sp. M6MM]